MTGQNNVHNFFFKEDSKELYDANSVVIQILEVVVQAVL